MRKNKQWWIESIKNVIENKWIPDAILKCEAEKLHKYFDSVNCKLCQSFKNKEMGCSGCIFGDSNATNMDYPGCLKYFPKFKYLNIELYSAYVGAKITNSNNLPEIESEFVKYIKIRRETLVKIFVKLKQMKESDFNKDYFPEILELGD